MNDLDHMAGEPRPDRALPFLLSDAFHLVLVFGWTVFSCWPTGRDYALLARPDSLDLGARAVFSLMLCVFGAWAPGYAITNLALLYGVMALLLLLTRRLTRGPWWLGSVAAVLFMANPVVAEAALAVAGVDALIPALFGLSVLLAYDLCRTASRLWMRWLPVPAYTAATLLAPAVAPVFLAMLVLARCRHRDVPSKRGPDATLLGLGVVLSLISGQWSMPGAWDPVAMFAPLYSIVYPLGMLPENLAALARFPVPGVLVVIVVLGATLWMVRRFAHPALSFGLLGGIVLRLGQGGVPFDPATLSGGGRLALSTALFAVAVAGVFHMLLRHPEHRRRAVGVSTALCIAAMALQAWTNGHWIQARHEVRRFQGVAADAVATAPGRPVALTPDIAHYQSAPVSLAGSVRWNTPFSDALPVALLPPAPLMLRSGETVGVLRYGPDGFTLKVPATPAPALPRPWKSSWWRNRNAPRPTVSTQCRPTHAPYPEIRIPYPDGTSLFHAEP